MQTSKTMIGIMSVVGAAAVLGALLGGCGGVETDGQLGLWPADTLEADVPRVPVTVLEESPAGRLTEREDASHPVEKLQVGPGRRGRGLEGYRCAGGLFLCDGNCVDLWSDPDYCGGCDMSCATPFCVDGRCTDRP